MLAPHDIILTLESQRWRVEQIRENGARLASAFGIFTTQGFGEITQPAVFEFGGTFIDRPKVSVGYSLAPGQELVDTRYPRGFAFVSDWWIDKRGHYTGAYLSFAVDTQSAEITTTVPDPNYKLIFDVTFQGVAMKQLPDWMLDN